MREVIPYDASIYSAAQPFQSSPGWSLAGSGRARMEEAPGEGLGLGGADPGLGREARSCQDTRIWIW